MNHLEPTPKLWPELTEEEKQAFADSLTEEEIEEERLNIELENEQQNKK